MAQSNNVTRDFLESFAGAFNSHDINAIYFISGDRGVTEWVFTGTRTDGTKVEVAGCDVFTFRNGKIAVKNSFRKTRNPVK